MNRREFILSATGLLVSASAFGMPDSSTLWKEPWFDPSYALLPTPEQQVFGLSTTALDAQLHPRIVNSLPITGLPLDLADFDREVTMIIRDAGIVGLSFALAIDKQLVITRGYGHLSSHDSIVAKPTSPGYLGSITKPLCSMAALTLVKDGKLKLDQRVLEVLPLTPLLKDGETLQPEINDVTVRMLMNHTSGLFNISTCSEIG